MVAVDTKIAENSAKCQPESSRTVKKDVGRAATPVRPVKDEESFQLARRYASMAEVFWPNFPRQRLAFSSGCDHACHRRGKRKWSTGLPVPWDVLGIGRSQAPSQSRRNPGGRE